MNYSDLSVSVSLLYIYTIIYIIIFGAKSKIKCSYNIMCYTIMDMGLRTFKLSMCNRKSQIRRLCG